MNQTYDAIVLGAGIMGSAAAYYLAQSGQHVLLLEQFELDHQKGSSYGHSRIIRYAYDNTTYIGLMKAAYPLWAAIEEVADEQLYTRTGGIDFGRADDDTLNKVIDALQETGIPHEVLSPAEAEKRFPQFHLDDDMKVLYQADAGILAASLCVRAHVRLAEKYGAAVLTNTPVTKITAHPDSVEVQTVQDTFTAGRLVITAGSWAKSVLAQLGLDLPLTPMACQEIYFDTDRPDDYMPDRFPTFIGHTKYLYDRTPYGLASNHGSGLKIAFHGGKTANHPSEINYTPSVEEVNKALIFANTYLPGVVGMRSTRVCLYTMTPDEHFLIDKHPEYSHIIFGGGCSGHSFKFGTLIGKILMELALEGKTQYDISLFNVARFL